MTKLSTFLFLLVDLFSLAFSLAMTSWVVAGLSSATGSLVFAFLPPAFVFAAAAFLLRGIYKMKKKPTHNNLLIKIINLKLLLIRINIPLSINLSGYIQPLQSYIISFASKTRVISIFFHTCTVTFNYFAKCIHYIPIVTCSFNKVIC